ncbi:NADH-quinone oxidoreductase subunit M [Symmachiella dynata]|uniref:complex I subunit 4 family protein n=1 Tax=Symmachiella dynata TaxID=2527995 RepID=UPI001188C6F7|nr:NADH-quinone oxidoreductase subunit M [Symmachiella dynata]QDT46651.1 NADH-quinone oxidoreductase subunit M [Symmachiella dynata]
MSEIVSSLVLLPLAGAIAVLVGGRARPRAAQGIATGFTVAALAATIWIAVTHDPLADVAPSHSEAIFYPPTWHIDGINVWLLVLTALLTSAGVLITVARSQPRIDLYLACLLILEAGLLGVFATDNLLWLFLCWEVTRVALFFLIGGWGGTDRRPAAIKFFLFTLVGSGLTFAGCGLLVLSHYWMSGSAEFTLNLRQLVEELPQLVAASSANTQYWAGIEPWLFTAIGLGFAIQVPLFPLHIWLQDAAVEAPTAGLLMLCGAWIKIGLYGWLRLLLPLFPGLCSDLAGYFLWPAAIGTIYGVMLALVQDDLKRLTANLTVSYASFSVLGLFSSTNIGINGSLLALCSHGLSLGIVICVTSALFTRYRTREAEAFSGLASRYPRLAGVTFVGVASLIALPLTSGFIATATVSMGVARIHPGFVITALVALVLCTWCFLRVMQRVFGGTFREPVIDHPSWTPQETITQAIRGDLNLREMAAVVPLILAVLCIGVAPQLFFSRTETAVSQIVAQQQSPPAAVERVDDENLDR